MAKKSSGGSKKGASHVASGVKGSVSNIQGNVNRLDQLPPVKK